MSLLSPRPGGNPSGNLPEFKIDLTGFYWYEKRMRAGSAVSGFPRLKPPLNPISNASSIPVEAFLSEDCFKIKCFLYKTSLRRGFSRFRIRRERTTRTGCPSN